MNPITPAQLTWRLLTAGELTRVYLDEMRRDFPPTELKPKPLTNMTAAMMRLRLLVKST